MVKYHFTWKMFCKHTYILIYSILLKIDFMKQQNVKCGFQKNIFISIFLYLLFDHFGINLHLQFL